MTLFSLPQSTVVGLPGEIYTSLLICLVLLVFCLVVKVKSRKVDPLKKPKGIMLLAEMAVTKVDKMVTENMGRQFLWAAPYIAFVMAFLFLSFTSGLFGLPSPVGYYMIPLSFALITFIAIHVTSIVYTKKNYYKRYLEPFFFFLPINLISMWAPLLSLSLRLFGNALAGWVLMSLVYNVFYELSISLFKLPLPIASVVTPFLHAYFDVFAGFIQALVFTMLTMLLISSEVPDEFKMQEKTSLQ